MRVWAGLAIAALTSMPAAQQARFVTKVESVRVDVLATSGGRPVTDLAATDFEVRDNGVLQSAKLLSSDTVPVNVMIALDASASLSAERLERLRNASRALLGKLHPGESAGLITFSHVVRLVQSMTPDVKAVEAALGTVTPSGNTSLIDATSLGLSLGEPASGRGLLVVFSDGVDTASWQREEVVVKAARQFDTVLYAVAVTSPGRSPQFLRDVADATGGKVFEVQSNDRLEATFVQILEEFRQRYLLSYTPTGVSKPGWHKIEVRVKRRGVSTRARAGYFAR